ncbi:MAG TPA: YncE family protein [Actinomycetota bacterium]|nr:YncE family protein [Actinomycetota bacterium]
MRRAVSISAAIAIAGLGGIGRAAPPAVAQLSPVPDEVVTVCRRAQAKASFAVLCPERLPRATMGHPSQPPPPLTARVLEDRGAIVGVEMGYGAPYPRGRARNHPGRFLHFAVLRGDVEVGKPPAGSTPLGVARLGGKRGSLFQAPPYASSRWGSYHGDHVVFRWRHRGVPYTASLHSWDRSDAVPLLGEVLADVVPAGELPASRSPEPPAAMTRIGLGDRDLSALDAAGDTLWLGEYYAGLHEVDLGRGDVVGKPVDVTRFPDRVAATADALWVVAATPGVIQRVDLAERRVTASLRTDDPPSAIAMGERHVWVASHDGGTVARIDPRTGEAAGPPIVLGGGPNDVAVSDGNVWVSDFDRGMVMRLDEATGDVVAEIRVGGRPGAIAASAGAVWTTDWGRDELVRIDPSDDAVVARVPMGPAPADVVAHDGAAWVADYWDGTVTRVDERTNEASTAMWGLRHPRAIAAVADRVAVLEDSGSISVLRTDATAGPRPGRSAPSWTLPAAAAVALAALLWAAVRSARRAASSPR